MSKRIIFIGADGAGFPLKEHLIGVLKEKGYEVNDMGTDSTASCHYPDYAAKVCKSVQADLEGAFGILVCGTGVGMSMCANKYKGIRAALCGDTYSAKMTRQHNNANVLCLGARVIGPCLAEDIVGAFLDNPFEGGRHSIRVDMMTEIEEGRK